MNKTLLIEIKDNSALVTLATINLGKWSILMSKNYRFTYFNDFFISGKKISYDISWIKKMKDDLEDLFGNIKIDRTFLSINNSYSLIENKKIKIDGNLNTDKTFDEIKKIIKDENPKLFLLDIEIDKVEKTPLKKIISFSYEMINKDLWKILYKTLESFDFKITKIISTKKIVNYALKKYSERSELIYNIQIEDNFSIFYLIKNKKIINVKKEKQGLKFIYKKISKAFNISIDESSYLFEIFGNIPPEAIIDNRIIYNGLNNDGVKLIFSKKDLSLVITKAVNEIFKDISILFEDKSKEIEIIFSGKISKLKGFEKYAKEKLNIKKVSIFKSNFIGLISKNEIFSIGMMYWMEERVSEIKFKMSFTDDYLNKNNAKNKKIVQIFKNKVNKYYNYI